MVIRNCYKSLTSFNGIGLKTYDRRKIYSFGKINSKLTLKLNMESVEEYDNELRSLFPEILSELVEIAVISEEAHHELDFVYQKLVSIDAKSTSNNEINI